MANQPGNNAPRGTSEEIQLRGRARRRLVGAIALVAIIVTVLPMVMVQEPKPAGQDIAINIPSVPPQPSPDSAASPGLAGQVPAAAVQKADVAPLPATPQADAAPVKPGEPPVAKAAPLVSTKPAKNAETSKVDVPAAKEEKAKESAAAEKPKDAKGKEEKAQKPSQPDKEGFVVQLGAFSSMANVKQLQAKLTASGIHSFTETLKTDSGSKIRVRAGPYASRQEAEKVRDKLKLIGEKNAAVVANK